MADKKSDNCLKKGGSAAVIAGRLLKAGKRRMTVAFAESCTGGLASSMMTDIAGSSDYFVGSIVAYSNGVKMKLLGVKAETIKKYGAVSSQTAVEMVLGVRKKLSSVIGVAITGIAGPTGGSFEKPVGTVFICVDSPKKRVVQEFNFKGNRTAIKKRSACAALNLLIEFLDS
jgi:PncC family amidohydrolase